MLKHARAALLLALGLAALGFAGAGDDESKAVRAVLDAQVEAWNRKDLDGFLAGYWNDPGTVFLSGGDRSDGFEAMRDRYRKRYEGEGRAMGSLEFSGVEVMILSPDSALARGCWGLTMPDGTRPAGLFTLILGKKTEGWRIIHDHTSAAIGVSEHAPPITHAFLATGGETYIRDGQGKITWRFPQGSRDGWVLPDGHVLLALNKSAEYPGGAAAEIDRNGKVVFAWKGTQSEVNTVQPLDGGNVLLTEAGDKPRLLEVDKSGKTVVEVPLKAQTANHHLQTRMSRKLPNGNYLVPQLLDKVVREYTPAGEVVWEAKTPDMPFTAIRLANGNTLIGCTLGNLVIEVDAIGTIVWQVTNDDLPGKPINDACGVQRLPNGNTVITSQHAQGNEVKLTEVTRDKTIVWSHRDPSTPSLHHFQILDTNGKTFEGRPLR